MIAAAQYAAAPATACDQ